MRWSRICAPCLPRPTSRRTGPIGSVGNTGRCESEWAYKGKPLYLWVKGQKPGDVTGDGYNEVWHAAKP